MPQKGIGQAWFYHAPSKCKSQSDEPVYGPPISQIPGMSGNSQYVGGDDPSTRMWLKESDSDYIRLAKQGGRPDLLVMKPAARAESDGPVGYPRCEWFYDNPTAHQSKTANSDEPYEFKLPAYMVHEQPDNPRLSNDGYVRSTNSDVQISYSVPGEKVDVHGDPMKGAARKPKKTVRINAPVISRPQAIKPPSDHLGPNAVHKKQVESSRISNR